jgi:integrase
MNDNLIPKPTRPRRQRFQRGSLQKRQARGVSNWIAYWWEAGHRRSQILGPCSRLSRPEALAEVATLLQPLNARAGEPAIRLWTLGDWILEIFLPLSRRKWKLSTASTTGERIRKHLVGDLGSIEMPAVTRELLQQYLESKASAGFSFSVVDHLRWDLRAIFRLAAQDRVIASNPADMLFTPPIVHRASRRVLSPHDVQAMLHVLDRRAQLIVRLALFSGMRPGEILALQWKHVADDHVQVAHRLYRGKLDSPKSERSKRRVALSRTTRELLREWRQQNEPADPEAWLFPSTKITTPLGRDRTWRSIIQPRLKTIGLEWASFQIMRRTHASLSRQAGIDPKLVADQLGHGLGVHLDVYTIAALDQRQDAVDVLEASLMNCSSENNS